MFVFLSNSLNLTGIALNTLTKHWTFITIISTIIITIYFKRMFKQNQSIKLHTAEITSLNTNIIIRTFHTIRSIANTCWTTDFIRCITIITIIISYLFTLLFSSIRFSLRINIPLQRLKLSMHRKFWQVNCPSGHWG